MTLRHGLLIASGIVLLIGSLAGCALRPPFSSEERQIDSTQLTPHDGQPPTAPFCLHVRYRNSFFLAYSDNRAEAWVTDGRCTDNGSARRITQLRVSWRADWYATQDSRVCQQTDYCGNHTQHIVEGRNLRCVAASARDGNQTAFITTDEAVCH